MIKIQLLSLLAQLRMAKLKLCPFSKLPLCSANCSVLFKLIIETLGGAFGIVKSDIQGNITKIKARYDLDPATSSTLMDIVNAEKKDSKKSATEALLWLKRGLQFTSLALRQNVDSKEELSVSFTAAYGKTLGKFHSFLIRPVFSVAMNACPTRSAFYKNLAGTESEEKV